MTRTGPGDIGVPACRRTVPGWPPPPGLARTNPAPATNRALAGSAVVSRPLPGPSSPVRLLSNLPITGSPVGLVGSGRPACRGLSAPIRHARRTRHVRVSPRWHFRFTCTCSGGMQHQFMDAHLIPEGTFYV
jgi:hypothetical protein